MAYKIKKSIIHYRRVMSRPWAGYIVLCEVRGAPGLTCAFLGMKCTASATVLLHGCLQPTKPWLEIALVYVAIAQAAGAEREPRIALSLLCFHDLLFSNTSRYCVRECSPILGLPVPLTAYSFARERQMPIPRTAKVLGIWEHAFLRSF